MVVVLLVRQLLWVMRCELLRRRLLLEQLDLEIVLLRAVRA